MAGSPRLIMNDGPCPAERFAPAALRVAARARRPRRSSMLLPPRHPPVSRDPVSDPVSLRFFQKTHGLAQAARLPGAAFQVFPAFSHKTSPLRIRTGHCSRPSRSKSRCVRRIVDVLAHDYQTPDACSGANPITLFCALNSAGSCRGIPIVCALQCRSDQVMPLNLQGEASRTGTIAGTGPLPPGFDPHYSRRR